MKGGVCAVVVTYNRKELLRKCLDSLLAQTLAPDCIVVVDNLSTDGTREMVDAEYPALSRHNLTSNTGGAGGFKAGMQWAYRRGYEWIWVMDDDIEMLPECLENMLQWQQVGDIIQVRKRLPWGDLIWEAMWDASSAIAITYDRDVSFANGRKWIPVQYCNFEGALIRRMVIERAGLPDERYFVAGDDTIYGYLASFHASVIYVDYIGVIKKALVKDAPRNRMSYYLAIRNRFLSHEHISKSGLPVSYRMFLFRTLLYTFASVMEALRGHTHRGQNVKAAIDGLRDGLHGRFGPPPWLR